MKKSNSKKRKQKPYCYLLLYGLCIVFLFNVDVYGQTNASQQRKKVTGTVVDTNGEALIGATIVEKDTKVGTISDKDGNFSLNVPQNKATLKVSFMGCVLQEITLSAAHREGTKPLHIILEEDQSILDEVVVVGYGSQKKVHLTGAVSQVKGDEISNRSVTNVAQALQGQVGNLNISSSNGGAPGATQSMNLRGYSGFGTSTSPMIVIDGIQGGNINNINMNDVESISVLKDAASAAIYGSNAPFGVILVTTKRGKAGRKPTITYENNFSFAQPMNLPKLMNSVEVASFFNEASTNSNYPLHVGKEQMERIVDYMDGLISYETKINKADGADSWLPGNGNNDWYDLWFKDVVFNQRHSVGVSGSTDRTSYYVGLGYLNQEGIFKVGEDRYQRYNARVNLSTEITNWLRFNARGSFARAENETIDEDPGHHWQGNRMHAIVRALAYDAFINPNGTKNDRYQSFQEAGKVKNATDNNILTGEFVLTPLKGWDITANYTLDASYSKGSYHQKTVYQTTPKNKVIAIYGTPNKFSRNSGQSEHHTINAFTSYEKQLGGHFFKVLGGYTQELYTNVGISGSNTHLYTDNIPALKLAYGPNISIDEDAKELAIRGVFGRINYNFQEKYLVEFNGRYDATSRYLGDVRYKFYPGASVAWLASREGFWKGISEYINTTKVRASYGELGSQTTSGYYPFYPSLNTVPVADSNYIFGNGRDVYVSQPPLVDPSLTWQTVASTNLGIDMAFLGNRLDLSLDVYERKVSDFAFSVKNIPAVLGVDPPLANVASIKTTGFELSLGWRDRIGAVNYRIKGILSDYKGKVTKNSVATDLIWDNYVGKEIGEIWGYETIGLFQTEEELSSAPNQLEIYSKWSLGDCWYRDLDGNNKIDKGSGTVDDPGDRRVIGNTTPRYNYSISLGADYKKFDLEVFIQGVGKRNSVSDTDSNTSTYFWGITGDVNQSNGFKDQLDRWSETNPNGFYPKFYWGPEMTKNKQVQTRYLQDASYLRLKNVQLGYTFPREWIQKAKIEKLRVFVNAENLFTITNMIKTMDPEFSSSTGYDGGPNGGYPDGKIYPLQRIWACGLNVTF